MSRGMIVALVVSLTIVMGSALSPGAPAGAQSATPSPQGTPAEVAPGVTFTNLPASDNPPTLYRLRFAPGASLPFADNPSISLIYVETGALTLQLQATVRDIRSNDATPAAAPANSAVTVRQGDYFVVPPMVTGEMRN